MERSSTRPWSVRARGIRGQALVWFLALWASAMAVLMGVYHSGAVILAKEEVVNAADAGALAGATQQARLLNLMAYGNRAMLVSDAWAAQLVSLDAWLQFAHTSTRQVGIVSRFLPGVGQVLSQGLLQASQWVGQVEEVYGRVMLPAALQAFDLNKRMVTGANQLLHLTGSALAQQVSEQVVVANGGQTSANDGSSNSAGVSYAALLALENQSRWQQFSRVYSGDERADAAFVVEASRDDFSTEAGRPGSGLTNVSFLNVRLEKRGGTRLVGFDRWEAQDTFELKVSYLFRKATWAIGWGRADAGSAGHLMWGRSPARDAAFYGRRDLAWSGISEVTDLTDTARQSPTLDFLTMALRPGADIPVKPQGMGGSPWGASGPGIPGAGPRLLADQVTSISTATVFFSRPQRGVGDWTAESAAGRGGLVRSDDHLELPSLYNPFWQARRTPVSTAHRQALQFSLGLSESRPDTH